MQMPPDMLPLSISGQFNIGAVCTCSNVQNVCHLLRVTTWTVPTVECPMSSVFILLNSNDTQRNIDGRELDLYGPTVRARVLLLRLAQGSSESFPLLTIVMSPGRYRHSTL